MNRNLISTPRTRCEGRPPLAGKPSLSAVLVLALATIASNAGAETIDVGPDVAVYTGSTRGFWFTAPTDFVITGLGVPTDRSTAPFDVAVLRLDAAPPLYAEETSDFDILHISRDVVGDDSFRVPVSIGVSSGDLIGILGSRGGSSTNSYGQTAYDSSLLGFDVTLDRLLMQDNLNTADPIAIGVSAEDGNIGRVYVDVSVVPEPSALMLVLLGVAGLDSIGRHRRLGTA